MQTEVDSNLKISIALYFIPMTKRNLTSSFPHFFINWEALQHISFEQDTECVAINYIMYSWLYTISTKYSSGFRVYIIEISIMFWLRIEMIEYSIELSLIHLDY